MSIPGPSAASPPAAQSAPALPTPTSVTNTTAISMGTAGGASVILWIFASISAGHLLTPDQNTAMIMAGLLAPIVHSGVKAITRLLGNGDS